SPNLVTLDRSSFPLRQSITEFGHIGSSLVPVTAVYHRIRSRWIVSRSRYGNLSPNSVTLDRPSFPLRQSIIEFGHIGSPLVPVTAVYHRIRSRWIAPRSRYGSLSPNSVTLDRPSFPSRQSITEFGHVRSSLVPVTAVYHPIGAK